MNCPIRLGRSHAARTLLRHLLTLWIDKPRRNATTSGCSIQRLCPSRKCTRSAISCVAGGPKGRMTTWVGQQRSRSEESILESFPLAICRFLPLHLTQVISRSVPWMLPRSSVPPLCAVYNRTIFPFINESGHKSAVTLHRTVHISARRYHRPWPILEVSG